jgi:toxin YoeB
MEVIFSPIAKEDLNYWKQKNNDKVIQRVKQLITAIQTDPFRGIGKPEPLKYKYSGYWSRRINHEHRIIYKVEAHIIFIQSLKEHY